MCASLASQMLSFTRTTPLRVAEGAPSPTRVLPRLPRVQTLAAPRDKLDASTPPSTSPYSSKAVAPSPPDTRGILGGASLVLCTEDEMRGLTPFGVNDLAVLRASREYVSAFEAGRDPSQVCAQGALDVTS